MTEKILETIVINGIKFISVNGKLIPVSKEKHS